MDDKNKIMPLGGKPGDKRVDVTVDKRSSQSEEAVHARALVKKAGELFQPDGAKYLGSVTVFYYSKETLPSHPEYFFACQTDLTNVDEPHAGLGLQALRTQMMEGYGRNERTRK